MKRLFLTAALIVSPVFAGTVDVYVVEPNGNGVLQYESDTTLQEAGLLIDGERPPTATGVVLEKGKPAKWTDLPPEDVNERHGGDGAPPIVNLDDSDMEFSGNAEDLTPEPDNLQSKHIQPRDGNWVIEIQDQVFSGCSGMIENAARGQMAALQTSQNNHSFGANFTPEKMAPQLDWTQLGANSWLGIGDMTEDGRGVFLQWGVQVISSMLINHRQHLTFAMGPIGNCDVHTFTQAAWVN
ncbi:MAG: hypothetical protein ABJJ53_05200 [Sulfitobacter sp.]